MNYFPVSLYFLSGAVAFSLSPCLLLFAARLYRAATKEAPKPVPVDPEKTEWMNRFEESQVQAGKMVERIRMLERLLIDERRQRLAETEEILVLRERVRRLQEKKNPLRLSPAAGLSKD